jgi:hypothetical protein
VTAAIDFATGGSQHVGINRRHCLPPRSLQRVFSLLESSSQSERFEGESRMSKRTAIMIDESKAKAAIDAVKDRKRPVLLQTGFQQRALRGKLRTKLSKELKPLFTGAGLDLGKIDKVLKNNQSEVRRSLAKDKAATAKQFAALAKQRMAGLANTRAALEHLANTAYLTTPIPVATPFYIGARPVGFLTDDHIEPWNNWGKPALQYDHDGSGSDRVSFYFAWQNPIDYLAVINCSADLMVNGHVKNLADDGIFTGGTATVKLRAELNVFVGQFEISWQAGQKSDIDTIHAEGSGIFDVGALGDRDVVATSHLDCTSIEVDGDQIVVFEVAFVADYAIDDGSIDIDFASGDRSVVCPVLNVELLTPPNSMPTPPFTSASARSVR